MPNYRNNMNVNAYSRSNQQRPMPHHPHPHQSYREVEPCPCENRDDMLEGMPIAMAYVPWQNWKHIYDLEKALCRGTIFEELDKPFLGKGGSNR